MNNKNTFQSGFLTVLNAVGPNPLQNWEKQVNNGHIKRLNDLDLQSSVLEILGTNVMSNYLTAPKNPKESLGIKAPYLIMFIKNLKKYFTFEVQILDDKNVRRVFRASNFQGETIYMHNAYDIRRWMEPNIIQSGRFHFSGLWDLICGNFEIHANCRIKRIYFSDKLYSEEDLPPEFKLFLPISKAT